MQILLRFYRGNSIDSLKTFLSYNWSLSDFFLIFKITKLLEDPRGQIDEIIWCFFKYELKFLLSWYRRSEKIPQWIFVWLSDWVPHEIRVLKNLLLLLPERKSCRLFIVRKLINIFICTIYFFLEKFQNFSFQSILSCSFLMLQKIFSIAV